MRLMPDRQLGCTALTPTPLVPVLIATGKSFGDYRCKVLEQRYLGENEPTWGKSSNSLSTMRPGATAIQYGLIARVQVGRDHWCAGQYGNTLKIKAGQRIDRARTLIARAEASTIVLPSLRLLTQNIYDARGSVGRCQAWRQPSFYENRLLGQCRVHQLLSNQATQTARRITALIPNGTVESAMGIAVVNVSAANGDRLR